MIQKVKELAEWHRRQIWEWTLLVMIPIVCHLGLRRYDKWFFVNTYAICVLHTKLLEDKNEAIYIGKWLPSQCLA